MDGWVCAWAAVSCKVKVTALPCLPPALRVWLPTDQGPTVLASVPHLQYGPLRQNGVILKTQKGRDSFAFVDFEDSAPAQVGGPCRCLHTLHRLLLMLVLL